MNDSVADSTTDIGKNQDETATAQGNEKIKDANDLLRAGGNDAVANAFDDILDHAAENLDGLKEETTRAQEQATKEKEADHAQKKAAFEKKLAARLLEFSFNDLFNARRIYIAYGNEIRYDKLTGIWGFFKDGVWSFDTDKNSALLTYTAEIARILSENRPKPLAPPTNEDGSLRQLDAKEEAQLKQYNFRCEYIQKKVEGFHYRNTQFNAIEMLKGVEEIIIRQSDLDQYPMLLNVKNGVIDLETGKLLPAAPELLLTKQANVIFDPTARAPVFEKFMQEILPDEETRGAVLRYLGYCLTGRVNEEKALFVWGRGANGKGTLFKAMLKLFGSYGTSFNIKALLKPKIPKDGESATPEIAKLEGVRIAIADEIPVGANFDVAKFKNLTGGDIVTARALYQPPKNFEPNFKFVLSGNTLPRLEGADDDGFNRRAVIVKFLQQFTGAKADQQLKARLEQPAELSGILNILIAECLDWQKPKAQGGGLLESRAMVAEKKEFLADNDWFSAFIEERCELGAEFDVGRKRLLNALKGYDPRARPVRDKLLEELILKLDGVTKEHGARHSKYDNVDYFAGIRLMEDNDSTPQP